MKLKESVFLFVLVVSGLCTYSQETTLNFKNFNGQINDNQVAVSFTLLPSNFCYGAQLYRTTDTTNLLSLEPVGEIEGVCGDQNFESSYTLFDEKPIKNQKAYYRLILGDFPTNFIPVEFVDFGNSGYLLYPNPTTTHQITIDIENSTFDPIDVELFDISGKLLKTINNEKASKLTLQLDELNSGVYFYRIFKNERLYGNGKLVVN